MYFRYQKISHLYGHCFTLITDHKPLLSLFKEKKAIPNQALGRIQRWALVLAAYEYKISFRPTASHIAMQMPLADFLYKPQMNQFQLYQKQFYYFNNLMMVLLLHSR